MVKNRVFFSLVILLVIGFANAFAANSSTSKPQSTPVVAKAGTIETSNSPSETNEFVFDFFITDSSLKQAGFINFIQPYNSLDSIELKSVINYLRKILPVVRSTSKQDVEMIEIL